MKTKFNKLKIAHRGLWNLKCPENSMGAFRRCINAGIPIELDVHIIKDDTLIVFHDDNLKRMCGSNKKVKDLNRDTIVNYRLEYTDYRIPTLKEVLDEVDGKVLLDIEIKTDVASFKICKRLANMLTKYKGEVLVKSFNPFYIAWFRYKAPQYKRGLLVSRLKQAKTPWIIKFLTYHMAFNFLAKPDFIAFDERDLPNKKIDKLHEQGMPILLWTITGEPKHFKYNGVIYNDYVKKNR